MSGEGRSPNGPTDEEAGQGPDGGVDLGLTKDGRRYLAQKLPIALDWIW